MNWLSLLIAAALGALAGGIAHLVTKRMYGARPEMDKRRRIVAVAVAGVIFGVMNPLTKTWIERVTMRTEFDASFARVAETLPWFTELMRDVPAEYGQFREEMLSLIRTNRGKGQDVIGTLGARHINTFVDRKVAIAAPDAVLIYARALQRYLRALMTEDFDEALRALFPVDFGPPKDGRLALERMRKHGVMPALVAVVRSARAGTHVPVDTLAIFTQHVRRCGERYPALISVITNPAAMDTPRGQRRYAEAYMRYREYMLDETGADAAECMRGLLTGI